MAKIRLLFLLLTIVVVGSFAYFISLYARGYRLNSRNLKFSAHGLLVIKSDPDGAELYINSEFNTATNATLSLVPGTYDLSVRKDGYLSWNKRVIINKEEVTEVTAHLFKSAPSLSSLTFSGVINPVPSPDMTRVAYIVPFDPETKDQDKAGLWVLETLDLPLGFNREPRRITDGDLANSSFIWSPDSREILLHSKNATYLINISNFTPQSKWINISLQEEETINKWGLDMKLKLSAKMKKLPEELQSILQRKSKAINFSPDEDMVLYIASGSASIPSDLIKPVPGASTQKQDRNLVDGKAYVYDIKEDRNYLIDEDANNLIIGTDNPDGANRSLVWFPTSRHLVLAEPEKITIMDYDGTNRQEVFKGSYVTPAAFSTLSHNRLLILTNLGATSNPTNLYSLSIK